MSSRDFDPGPLAELLRSHCVIGGGKFSVERVSGGQSNPNYKLTSSEGRLILRKKPPGELLSSAHALDREYRVIKALQGSEVPVPAVYLYIDDASFVGTPFYVMEFLDGRILMDQSMPGLTSRERTALYDEMNRVIAALHCVDYAAAGLADFGKTGNYFARQIARWTRQAQDSRDEEIPALDALIAWLPGHIPPGDETTIVHGDYRLDNLVFHPSEARAIGVLDWELSTLGHPLADFSYNCLSWHIPPTLWRGFAGLDLPALGIPSEASYVRSYAEATGFSAASEHWNFYIAYNLFRLAAISLGVGKRARDGNAAAADAEQTGRLGRPMAELGWTYAQRHDASMP
jgi:aminoglycoside phosphotransferase (APT) family kinase protein